MGTSFSMVFLRKYLENFQILPALRFSQDFDLILEIGNNFVVLLFKQHGGFFGFQMDVFKHFTHFHQFSITFAVSFELLLKK